jgi:hypothetical protein
MIISWLPTTFQVARESASAPFSHVFCAAPSIVRDGSRASARQAGLARHSRSVPGLVGLVGAVLALVEQEDLGLAAERDAPVDAVGVAGTRRRGMCSKNAA